jgi:ethanolaminephosphotransferase
VFRPPILQSTPERATLFVWAAFGISAVAYARFVLLVISDITEFLGIACMTVRKKDANGNWRSAGEVDKEKKN